MAVQAFNPNTLKAEAGRSLRVLGQPGPKGLSNNVLGDGEVSQQF